ncbi:hypothetical protein N665_2032s0008 [Sinapis alba]|nr:hypothetical protein N665_2032s0008 [Sinapis alba]
MSTNPKLSISTFILLLLLLTSAYPSSSDDLEQLLAVDEQLQEDRPEHQQSKAETVSKAQRIVLELTGDNAKRAATGLKEIGSQVLMAKIDGDRYGKDASELEIEGFPTLLLFVNGTSQAYTGGFSAEDIVIWVQKKTAAPIITVNSLDEAQTFWNFVKAAKADNEIQFVETSDSNVAKLLFLELKTSTVFVGMVKAETERYTAYDGPYKMEKLLEFVGNNKFPLITRLTESNTVWVYSSPVKLQIMIFSKADVFQNLAQPLEDLARKFKSKLMFIYVDITNKNLAMPFLTLFGIEDANKTVVAAFDNNLNSKYLLESDPSPSNIEDFCSGLADGARKTFDELVLNSRENVHTPWCVNGEAMSKQVLKLAKHFKGFENLVFARIDASVNEHAKLQVDDFPTIFLTKDMAVFINEKLRTKDGSAKDEL